MIQRNYSIDVLKLICAILVVFLHTGCAYHDMVLPLTRCAVPCFFMISGYMLYNENGIGEMRLKRSIVKILKIIFYATILFGLLKECQALLKGNVYVPTHREMFDFLVLNENPFAFHLWYLGAYLYVLIIALFVEKYGNWKYLFYLIPILLAADLLFGKYSLLLLGKEFPYIYVRNFLFVGIPYFGIGVWMKVKTNSWQSINSHILTGGVILFSLTSVAEKYVLLYLDKNPMRDHYLSTTFLAICIFMYALSHTQKHPNTLSRLGEQDSLYIYIFHPIFLLYVFPIVNKFMPEIWATIYYWTAPFIVLTATIILTKMLRKLSVIK